jgi:hypothetical protein
MDTDSELFLTSADEQAIQALLSELESGTVTVADLMREAREALASI